MQEKTADMATFPVRLNDEITIKLQSLATFDPITLAMEIKEAIELCLKARPDDYDYRHRIHQSLTDAIENLGKVPDTQKIIEILTPLLKVTGPK